MLPAQTHGDEMRTQLSPRLDQAIANVGAPGLAVAVLREGKPVFVETRGVADLASKRPVTTDCWEEVDVRLLLTVLLSAGMFAFAQPPRKCGRTRILSRMSVLPGLPSCPPRSP